MKKRVLFSLLAFLLVSITCAESFKIENISYDLSGITRENSLKNKVPVDTTTVFENEESLNSYLSDLQQRIFNYRVFDTVEVIITSKEPSSEYTKISLLIKTKDTWNIIALPYPSYDSNSGFKLKLKIKDYNFLGSMETFDVTSNYKYDPDANTHDIDFSFDVPFPTFKVLTLDASVGMDFEIAYTYGDNSPSFDFGQNIDFSKQLNKTFGISFGFSNSFIINPDYKEHDDMYYFSDNISLSLPVTLATIDTIGNITWTPQASFNFKWDFDAFNSIGQFGITNPDLFGPSLSFGHSISTGRVDWDGNFRKGFNISVAQTFDYNFYSNSLNPYFKFNSKIFNKFSDKVALATCQQYFLNVNGNVSENVGGELRGIRNGLFNTDSALILNFDLPIKLFQTDWVNFFNFFGLNWGWTSYVDFEFQFNPFIDIALCKNQHTGTQFLIEDGFYSCGFEMLVYPNKMKSITGRVSFGLDAVKVLDKVGNKVSIVDKVTNRVFNTDWRYGSMWELFVGIGLFY